MGKEWSMRAYREGDEDRIFELFKAVYPENEYDYSKWLRWWHWMYNDNPAGPGLIFVAEDSGTIVGQYPLIFMQMKVGDEIMRVAQNINLMTHPDYGHQGIFKTLEKTALDQIDRQGVRITIGFPNEPSYPGHKKSGWFDISNMKIMYRPLNWRESIGLGIRNRLLSGFFAIGAILVFDLVLNGVLRRTRKLPAIEGLSVTRVSSFDERIDALWAKVANQFKIIVVRTKAYLNWRYGAPGAKYSMFVAEKAGVIQGYLISQQKEGESGIKGSLIFDLVAQSEDVLHSLIRKLITDCRQNKVAIIQYPLIANKTYHKVLKRNGFISLPFVKGDHFCAYSTLKDVSEQFLRNPDNWFVQIGDSDLI